MKYTKIGSPYAIAELSYLNEKLLLVAGCEANGGFLLGNDVVLNNKTLKKDTKFFFFGKAE